MQLQESANKIRRSDSVGTEETGFKLLASAKAFDILSNNLYSNKIRAIIRELSCNAYDAQKEAGRETVPFKIHLPNYLDRHFSIRDFGTGLSESDLKEVYTTFFASTKTDSNDYIGCLGLGSKTPFSYTDNFSVTSFYKGQKYSYIAFKNEEGIPVINHVLTSETEEMDGLEVKFAVKDVDFSRFQHEANYVFAFFRTLPTIENLNSRIVSVYENPVSETKHWIISDISSSKALMGNVAYDLTMSSMDGVISSDLLTVFNTVRPILLFPIGSIVPAPNRETLSYDKLTLKSIEKSLTNLKDSIDLEIQSDLDSKPSKWEAIVALKNNHRFGEYIRSTSTEFTWNGEKLPTSFNVGDILEAGDFVCPINVTTLDLDKVTWGKKAGTFRTSKSGTYFSYLNLDPKRNFFLIFHPAEETEEFKEAKFRKLLLNNSEFHQGTYYLFKELSKAACEYIIETLGIKEGSKYYWSNNLPKLEATTTGSRTYSRTRSTGVKLVNLNTKSNTPLADTFGSFVDIDLEEAEGFYILREANDGFYAQNKANMADLCEMIRFWNAYIKADSQDQSLLIKNLYSLTKTQYKKAGPNLRPIEDAFLNLGFLLVTEDLERTYYYEKQEQKNIIEGYNNNTGVIKTFETFLSTIPNLELQKGWDVLGEMISKNNSKEIRSKEIRPEKLQFLESWIRWNYHLDRSCLRRFYAKDLLGSSLDKFEKEHMLLIDAVTEVRKKHPIIDMFLRLNSHKVTYKQGSLNPEEWYCFEETIEYIKQTENL